MAINNVRMVDSDGKITREWMPFFRNIELLLNSQTFSGGGEAPAVCLTLAQVLASLGSIATRSEDDYTSAALFWSEPGGQMPNMPSPLFFEGDQISHQKASPSFFENDQQIAPQSAANILVWL